MMLCLNLLIMKKIACMVVSFALFNACNEPVNPEPDPVVDPESTEYTCVLPVVEYGKARWESGDKILFHGGSADNQKIVTLTEADIIDDTLCKVDLSGLTPYKAMNVSTAF